MKKLLFLLSFCATPLFAGVLSNEMGMGQPGAWLGSAGSISATNTDLNGSYTANNSTGVALGIRFTSPVNQTNGNLTLYLYTAAITGAPSSIRMDVLAGPNAAEDPQRPSTATVIATGAVMDLSSVPAPAWSTFTATGVNLSTGVTYWCNLTNLTDTPTLNFPSFRNRALNLNFPGTRITGWQTLTGYTTDPTAQGSNGQTEFSAVLKFDDGTIMGHSYVLSTAHASNTNDRGVRFKFSSSVKVYGIMCTGGIASGATHVKVYQGATLVSDLTLDFSEKTNPTTQAYVFGNTITLSAGLAYDFMFTGMPGTTTTFSMIDANNAKAGPDVLAATLQNQTYVEGTTPGSYTATANTTGGIVLMLDSLGPNPGNSFSGVNFNGQVNIK